MTSIIEAVTIAEANNVIDFLAALDQPANVIPIESARKPDVIRYDIIKDRDRKHYEGSVLDGAKAEVIPGKSIRIFGTYANCYDGPRAYDITFNVGDEAVHGSYNFEYTAKITQIGPASVYIAGKRLNLYEFSNLNWDYNAERIKNRRANWMD